LKTSEPFLIAGGGIGGLAAALALAAKGYRAHVLEQAPEFKEIGAGLQLGPNSWRCLRALGAEAAAKPLAVFPGALVIRDGVDGKEVLSIPLAGFEHRFGAPYALIHRADLLNVLLETAKASPSITLQSSAQVKSFRDDGEGVTVTTSDGRQYRGAALIGADGLWSNIRTQIVNDGKPRVSGHIAYRAVLSASEVPERLQHWNMVLWAGPKCHMVYYRLRGGELFNLVAVFHSARYEEGWNSYGDPEELHRRFENLCDDVKLMLKKIAEWRMWVLCDREPVKNWSKGRVTLLGDAAHPMLQYLAQGSGMAMEDSLCLARCLDESSSIEEAFAKYPLARYLRTGRVQLTARVYGEFYHAEGVVRDLRNDFVKNLGYEGLSWVYDYQP
jgi:2-polyprenyl-6-methoxyphenol hydroxylase-like FAD-dependent oxidoreductase